MKVDASQVLGQGGVKIKAGTGTAADALKKGDVVRAEVVSDEKNGLLTLKMENGHKFTAKLGTDIKLSPGDVILLEVSEKDKNQISLSFSGVETKDDDFSTPQTNLVKNFDDKSLALYAGKLAEHNIQVTEESARMMRELMGRYPGISLDEAAFLASNKLTGDESLIKAALAALASGEKTDAMITRLLTLADEQSPLANQKLSTENPVNSTPLTELLTLIVKSFGQGETAPKTTVQTIITQNDINVQVNDENDEEILSQIKTGDDNPAAQQSKSSNSAVSYLPQNLTDTLKSGVNFANAESTAQNLGSASQNISSSLQDGIPFGQEAIIRQEANIVQGADFTQGTNFEQRMNFSQGADTAQGLQSGAVSEQSAESIVTPQTTSAHEITAQTQSAQTASMGGVVAELLSNIPEFSGTPRSALQRFSEMLLRVAQDSTETNNNSDTLTAQLNKLFTRIGKDDTNAGAQLRDAREELYTRLALIEESISRATQPARAELLTQTQKLMDHVRLLNSTEQFVYMQLPVQLSQERKAAELYVFKRKGSKRADPDNVNILLAIDLEFMGHWEALVNIKNKDVSIQMEVQGEAEKEHFNSNTVMLHRMLDDAGYKLVSTNIKFSEKETTPLTALSTLDRYSGGKQGVIDFKI